MPPKGMKYRELYLQCEWSTCKDIFTDSVDNFISHVKVHVQEFLSSQHGEGNERQASQECQWKDCDYVSSGSSNDLVKHTYFHAYHTKLKWYGLQEQTRCKLNPCQLDMQSRNLIPDLPERFQCDWHQCMYHVDNPEYFYRHVEMHAMTSEPIVLSDNSEGVVCRWGGCHTNCKNKYKLKEHLKSHTQEKMYGCCVCGGLFYNRTKYVDHLDRQLAVELQRFQCSHCSKTFSTERLLRDHMRHHVNHYKCPFCDMTCPAPSALNKHIRYRHLDEKLHRCDLCEYSCKSAYDLRRHIDSHNAALMLKCQVNDCSYKTKAIQSLRLHYKKVHHNEEARYLCHICDNSFSRGSLLTKHLKKKHKFKWPSGHPRFRYKLHDDGFYRLQTVRYESVELTEQLINEKQQSSHGSRQEEQTMVEHEQSGNSSDSGDVNSDSSESKDSTPCVQNSSKQSDSLTILANTAEKILLGIS
ncbi:histone H4 transcription factor-like [Saccoglossus kowalevskii]